MPPNDRYLTLDTLRKRIEDGEIDTVVLAFTDMQGRLQGKRLHGAVLPRRGGRARHGGLQLPARRRHRHEHRRRLRDLVVGARVRRHGVRPRLGHDPAAAAPARDARSCSATWSGSTTRRSCSRRARSSGPSSTPSPSAVSSRWRARSSSSSRSTRRTRTPDRMRYRGLDPVNQYNVDYSILGTTRAEPLLRDIRNTMYAAGLDVEARQGRVQLRPARDRLPVRRGDGHRRQPQRLQDRRQGDRRPARAVDHLHGEVQRARGQLLPHPPLAAR